MNFQEYLISKKIDSEAFRQAEPDTWHTWKEEFEQVHPNSFTVQKLNLINPVRRKYLLTVEPAPVVKPAAMAKPAIPGKPVVSKPAIKPAAAQLAQPAGQPVADATPPPTDAPLQTPPADSTPPAQPPAKPAVPRPVFKPKPKTS